MRWSLSRGRRGYSRSRLPCCCCACTGSHRTSGRSSNHTNRDFRHGGRFSRSGRSTRCTRIRRGSGRHVRWLRLRLWQGRSRSRGTRTSTGRYSRRRRTGRTQCDVRVLTRMQRRVGVGIRYRGIGVGITGLLGTNPQGRSRRPFGVRWRGCL